MQRILFIILLFTGYVYSQQVQPLVADTNSSGAYDVNYIKILGTKNDATHHRLPVDISGGTINATITGGATSDNQTNGNQVVKGAPQPTPVRDSLYSNTGASYPKILNYAYCTIANLTLTNLTGTADTLSIQAWCVAKNAYSLYNFGLRDISSGASGVGTPDVNESNDGIIIIPANTSRVFQVDGYGRIGLMQISWYNTAGKTSAKIYLNYQKVN